MAQSKRQDLSPLILDYWELKLRDYRDLEICEAILAYRNAFFPDVDEITEIIDRTREHRAEQKRDEREAEEARREQKRRAEWLKTHASLPQAAWDKQELKELQAKISMSAALRRLSRKAMPQLFEGPEGAD